MAQGPTPKHRGSAHSQGSEPPPPADLEDPDFFDEETVRVDAASLAGLMTADAPDEAALGTTLPPSRLGPLPLAGSRRHSLQPSWEAERDPGRTLSRQIVIVGVVSYLLGCLTTAGVVVLLRLLLAG